MGGAGSGNAPCDEPSCEFLDSPSARRGDVSLTRNGPAFPVPGTRCGYRAWNIIEIHLLTSLAYCLPHPTLRCGGNRSAASALEMRESGTVSARPPSQQRSASKLWPSDSGSGVPPLRRCAIALRRNAYSASLKDTVGESPQLQPCGPSGTRCLEPSRPVRELR